MDQGEQLFKCGFSVERGFQNPPQDFPQCELKPDWDWNRLLKQLRAGSAFAGEINRLLKKEGFFIDLGNWEERRTFRKNNLPGPETIRKILKKADPDSWAGFQVYYPMTESDILESSGVDLIESMLAVFREVTTAMNRCMQKELLLR